MVRRRQEGGRPVSEPAREPGTLEITVSSRYAKFRPEWLRLVTRDGDVVYEGPLPESIDGSHTLVGLPNLGRLSDIGDTPRAVN
jgi:hypothetical protein